MKKINVTKSFLPDLAEYVACLEQIWATGQIANNGAYVLELEKKLRELCGAPYALYCANGTLAIQLALKTLQKPGGEVVTTPFSYVATVNAALWESYCPVFADVRIEDFNLDPALIEDAITPRTVAILATHVFGNPCDTEAIADIARRHGLTVIYDGAHAFGAYYRGKPLLGYGDMATCSFHATKLFHTAEGGAVLTADETLHRQLGLYRQFGHIYDDYYTVGINAKASELHAALGLCILPKVGDIMDKRRRLAERYDAGLCFERLRKPVALPDARYNYAYYPVLFDSEALLLQTMAALQAKEIFPRRYFYPSLNTLPFLEKTTACPVSESAAARVLCLPLSYYLSDQEIEHICHIVNHTLA